ncbi:tryptophan transporter [Sporosarcina sp. ACRSM]|uniref:tryptophan transporter n=1 Tax=Sporosarcina sp. ACRSM TaxID=2918216 RepID=UPI001EF5BE3C|nr:tryptophan transporter [Sporosarcina sp. ACRSM]MCG7337509.1 tryptophan transporter [Sporosarcina sp. ACRSM]
MKTKELVLMALLVAVGAALYLIIPGYGEGMKPDFMLTMMFIGIILFPTTRNVFLLALTTGVISGIFSSFPGGFIPNIIDKFVTAFVVYGIIILLKKLSRNLIATTVVTGIGTVLSGSIFLSVALFLLGVTIPGFDSPAVAFTTLFVLVVLPAILMNCIAFFIIYPIVTNLMKRSSFKSVLSN